MRDILNKKTEDYIKLTNDPLWVVVYLLNNITPLRMRKTRHWFSDTLNEKAIHVLDSSHINYFIGIGFGF
jgi:hypothetical protein